MRVGEGAGGRETGGVGRVEVVGAAEVGSIAIRTSQGRERDAHDIEICDAQLIFAHPVAPADHQRLGCEPFEQRRDRCSPLDWRRVRRAAPSAKLVAGLEGEDGRV